MALTKNQKFLLEEVFPKVKYDETLQKYIIHIDDYVPLNLTTEQYRLLEKMCNENNIELEKLPKRMQYSETEKLLIEYNELKKKIDKNPNSLDSAELIKRKIEIRNRIVEGYMIFVYKLIWKKYIDINDEQDREDIYQIGYEVLFDFIDKYEPSGGLPFEIYVRSYILGRIIDGLIKTNKGFKLQTGRELRILLNAKKQLLDKAGSLEKISDITGFSKEKIEFLETLEKMTQDISLEEFLESEPVSDFDLEEELIDKTIKENLVKLLNFLTEEEREIIKLYYGFYDNIEYSLEEIATIRGYNNRERVRQIKEKAIFKLKMPIYNIHISSEASESSMLENYLKAKKELFIRNRIEEYEIILLTSLPEGMLESLMANLSEELQTVLSLHLGLNGKRHNIAQISRTLNISKEKTKKLIASGLFEIKTQINNRTKRGYRQGEYYKYLTQLYFKRSTKR